MNLKAFLKKNGVLELTEGFDNVNGILGKRVWICDYRLGSGGALNKPIRAIIPKLVEVCGNTKGKSVYYSPVHFREVKQNKVLSTVIPPYDNTGYRCYAGVSLNIFEEEKECRMFFEKQCEEAVEAIEKEIKKSTSVLKNKKYGIIELMSKEGYKNKQLEQFFRPTPEEIENFNINDYLTAD